MPRKINRYIPLYRGNEIGFRNASTIGFKNRYTGQKGWFSYSPFRNKGIFSWGKK